jgi:hypothetical protein
MKKLVYYVRKGRVILEQKESVQESSNLFALTNS